ncbi:hypothetical protein [Dyella kyungheensis]|uniref:Uncharacterized protein n=1 Tax=Dyella kyungheensis TaxID=1242174 RepID=A0ABS2JSU0_9GAMM|nr:hypothetical protein [Dyella kyungheensis]MBM7121497.1 hypothetical protein [Dyella kyungheensis]
MTLQSSDYTAIGSGVVALCALIVSIIQVRAVMQHNRLQTRPLVDVYFGLDHNLAVLELRNHGLGPAIIKSILAKYKGRTYELTSPKELDELAKQYPQHLLGNIATHTYYISPDTPIRPGTDLVVFMFTEPKNKDALNAAHELMDNLHVSVTYKCIYGNQMQASSL